MVYPLCLGGAARCFRSGRGWIGELCRVSARLVGCWLACLWVWREVGEGMGGEGKWEAREGGEEVSEGEKSWEGRGRRSKPRRGLI